MRVLIVDDSDFIRLGMRKMLEDNNMEVVGEASNGKEAVQKYKELRPSIVTMDITMPEMDGRNAIEVIMEMDPNAKIIVCSSMGQETIVFDAIKLGAKSFLVKPISEDRLIEEIKKVQDI